MNYTSLSRRELLAALAAAGLGPFVIPRAEFKRIGLQLYTLRRLAGQDLDGTLAGVAKVGYKEVETHTYYGKTPADFRKSLDAAGLTAPSAHVPIEAIDTSLSAQLEAAATIGHKWLVVPSLPGKYRTGDGYKQVGEILGKAAAQAKAAGVRIGYHNHDIDFAPIAGSTGMELILKSSPPEVAAELDVYWIVKAGGDPFAFIEKYPKRVKMLHLKDASAAPELGMRDVGSGTIDWPRMLPRAEAAGVEHVFVEHDNPGADPMAAVKSSYDYLSKLPAGRSGR
jgi:sugar phosphate isomerase/epimerase